VALGRIMDGLLFVSVDGYLHGQDDVEDMYLGPWGGAAPNRQCVALQLKCLADSNEWRAIGTAALKGVAMLPLSLRYSPLREIRDSINASNTRRHRGKDGDLGAKFDNKQGTMTMTPTATTIMMSTSQEAVLASSAAAGMTMLPEGLYNVATQLFNDNDCIEAGKLYELLCSLSNCRLYPVCMYVVYIRTTVCNLGYHGYGYEEDMRTIAEVMISEAAACRSKVGYRIRGDLVVVRGNEAAVMKVYSPVVDDGGTIGIGELRRLKGIRND
jgi:hypothetical protein